VAVAAVFLKNTRRSIFSFFHPVLVAQRGYRICGKYTHLTGKRTMNGSIKKLIFTMCLEKAVFSCTFAS
jgi:hypothetical protein